jgi:hypothetical protein
MCQEQQVSQHRSIRCLPPSFAEDAAFLFVPGLPAGDDAVPFLPDGLEPRPERAPSSSTHLGQNHSPSGMASRGGSRQPRWYGWSHYPTNLVSTVFKSQGKYNRPYHTPRRGRRLRCPYHRPNRGQERRPQRDDVGDQIIYHLVLPGTE